MVKTEETQTLKTWKKHLMRACLTGTHDEVKAVLEQGRFLGFSPRVYDAALKAVVQAATSKDKILSTVPLLVEYDAARFIPRSAFTFILHQIIALQKQELLIPVLDNGGKDLIAESPNVGRSLLLTAALRGDKNSLHLLAHFGADIRARDPRGRTVLIQLAADKAPIETNTEKVVKWFAEQDGSFTDEDASSRNVVHWAAAMGKVELLKALLEHKPDLDVPSSRGRTALHLSAASDAKDSPVIIDLLLRHGCDVNKHSDGGWTPLHNASQNGNVPVVQKLLEAGADVNAVLTSGVTPLHWAATRGMDGVARLLLEAPAIRRNQEDIWGSTPMLRAAQNGQATIVQLLAPHHDVKRLPVPQQKACKSQTFRATVTDFEYKQDEDGRSALKSLVRHELVHNILYNPKCTIKIHQRTSPLKSKPNFRWIHFPANNMTWAKTLFTKIFVEEQTSDIDSFKALQKTPVHRGPMVHSTFMIPACTHIRSNKLEEQKISTPNSELRDDAATVVPEPPKTPTPMAMDRQNRKPFRSNRPPKISYRTPQARESLATLVSSVSASRDPEDAPRRKLGNVSLFMPYLHYEDHDRRLTMSEIIRRRHAPASPSDYRVPSPDDETLIEAYLDNSASLHPRRTLDQFLYHGFDTKDRDIDQVVYRYCEKNKIVPKVYMVDQLWLWIFGNDLIVTCFPQRWAQRELRNDPLNVLNGIIEDINSRTRPPVESVSDLAILIFSRCLGFFDRHQLGNLDYQFMDMFESSIGRLSVREPELFKKFERAASDAAVWLHERGDMHHRKRRALHDNELEFVTELLDIAEETKELKELKDIRDELNIIRNIFEQQQMVLRDFEEALAEQQDDIDESRNMYDSFGHVSTVHSDAPFKKSRFREQIKLIDLHIRDVDRMDRQAKAIFDSLTQLLDFKQKHANAVEAKVARLQAGLTARQGETIMVFTIVTIVFLPMSFVAAFFTISVKGFESMSLAHVSKFVFGIGLAISVILVVLAFLVDDVRRVWRDLTQHASSAGNPSTLGHRDLLSSEPEVTHQPSSYNEKLPEITVHEQRVSFEPARPVRSTSGLSATPSTATWRSAATSWRRSRGGYAADRRAMEHV